MTQSLTVTEISVPPTARARRLVDWCIAFQPLTPLDAWLVGQMAANSVRVDDCQHREASLTAYLARRASLCWEDDRCLAAEEVAAGLSRRPALVVRKLRRTRQGCHWLIARWKALGDLCRDGHAWTEDQTGLAFDLLGTRRDERRGEPWASAGSPEALVTRETDRLERLCSESLDELDRRERAAAEAGVEIEPFRPLVALRRYEAASMKRLHWARKQLSTGGDVTPSPALPEAEPAPPYEPCPGPEPEPRPEPTDEEDRAYEDELLRRMNRDRTPRPEVERFPAAVPPPSALRPNRKTRRAALRQGRSV